MAITVPNDMVIYNDELISSIVDTLQQETEAITSGSNGAINVISEQSVGEFRQRARFSSNVHIKRRDPGSTAAQTPTNLPMGETVSAKLHKTYDVEATYSSFYTNGLDMGTFSAYAGQQVAVEKVNSHLNTALLVTRAALESQAGALRYVHATPLDHKALIKGMAKLGDKANRIRAFVMHSAHSHTLMEKVIDDNITDVAGTMIVTGMFPSFNVPVIITDSPALVDPTTAGNYVCMALTENAVSVIESEQERLLTEPVGGLENLVYRIQGEYAINVESKGMAYVKASGANPDDATLGVAANFQRVASDIKQLPGVLISAPPA